MPTPRYHPFIRLFFFATGVLFSTLLVSGVVAYIVQRLPSAEPLTNNTAALLLITLLTYPLYLLWMWFCRRTCDFRSFVSLGLRRTHARRDYLLGCISGAATIALLFGVLFLTGFIQLGASTGQIWSAELLEAGVPVIVRQMLIWVGVFTAVGFVEELIFRGYGFHNLTAWMGVTGATITQAILFAVAHMGNVASVGGEINDATMAALQDALRALPGLTLIAIFFALCYLKTGSLWFPIGFHVAWNFCLGCIFSLPVSGIPVPRLLDVSVSGSPLITGGAFGPEGSLLLLPIIAAMCYVLLRQPNHPQAELDLTLIRPPKPILETEEETHTPRFKTSMRSRTQTLEPAVTDSLRQLSEAKAARRQEALTAARSTSISENGSLLSVPEVRDIATVKLPQSGLAASEDLPSGSAAPTKPVTQVETKKASATVTVSEPPAPAAPPARPATQPTVAPRQPEPGSPPSPRKPPAPRW